jgi:hypothetical protein
VNFRPHPRLPGLPRFLSPSPRCNRPLFLTTSKCLSPQLLSFDNHTNSRGVVSVFIAKISTFAVSPLESALTENTAAFPNSQAITPLESISNLLSPLEFTLTENTPAGPKSRPLTPLESISNLLSPLELTLTKNAPVSPLESTLTKSVVLKSHRIILLQKRGGGERANQVSPTDRVVGGTAILGRIFPRATRTAAGEAASRSRLLRRGPLPTNLSVAPFQPSAGESGPALLTGG